MSNPTHPMISTIEHVYDKTEIQAYAVEGDAVVMSCYKCNQEKNDLQTAKIRLYAEAPFEFEFPNMILNLCSGWVPNQIY